MYALAAFSLVGLALSMKQTAFFFVPIMIYIYCVDEGISWLCFPAMIVGYILPGLPSLIAGCSFYDTYIEPWNSLRGITAVTVANFTNVYSLFPWGPNWASWVTDTVMSGIGRVFCLALLGAVFLHSLNKNVDAPKVILLQIVFVVILCCTLPGVHDRYMLLADLLSILYCFISHDPKRWQIAVFINFVSFYNVMSYLHGCLEEISNTKIVMVGLISLAFVAFTAWLIKHYAEALKRNDHDSVLND